MSESRSSSSVQKEVDTVQHALSMIGGTGWIARSEAEIALGRLAAWAEHGLVPTRTTHYTGVNNQRAAADGSSGGEAT